MKTMAVLYGLTSKCDITVDTIQCSTCKHAKRLIGPDLGDYGLFNWNNTMIFSHELLNAYINMYTASETPFSAFCLTVWRWYRDSGTITSFCSDETFVRVWFAYVQLLDIDSKMTCPRCGPNPDVIIVDGVSLSTHISKLTQSIRPPTTVDDMSEVVESITSHKARELSTIPQKDIHSYLLRIITTPPPAVSSLLVDLDIEQAFKTKYPKLAAFVDLTLQALYSTPEYQLYRALLKQIAAPDIVLQLVPYDAITLFLAVEKGDSPEWLQRYCPALGAVLKYHRRQSQIVPSAIRHTAGWLARRASHVYTCLAQHEPGSVDRTLLQEDWRETGTVYGSRMVRKRRNYTKLRYDSNRRVPDQGEGDTAGDCNKFYKTYSKHNLTGGILQSGVHIPYVLDFIRFLWLRVEMMSSLLSTPDSSLLRRLLSMILHANLPHIVSYGRLPTFVIPTFSLMRCTLTIIPAAVKPALPAMS